MKLGNRNIFLGLLDDVFELIKQSQPLPLEANVAWIGPYYIPRCGIWAQTEFRIYQRRLCVSVSFDFDYHCVHWKPGSKRWAFEGALVEDRAKSENLWIDVLSQVSVRLRAALKNPSRYNRMIQAKLPPSCRAGKIQRALTWTKTEKRPFTEKALRNLERLLAPSRQVPLSRKVTVSDYLATAAIAYDAAFKELAPLPAAEKYKAKADGRHGGMLDLPSTNAKAFADWFSRRWVGAHPFEIVFDNPHGIMLSPCYHKETTSWSYALSVSAPGCYVAAARMAIALAEQSVPFEFIDSERVLETLRGVDLVEVRGGPYSLRYEELKLMRPDALEHIQWEPIPQFARITPDQSARLRRVLAPSADIQDESSAHNARAFKDRSLARDR
jgi:hypothetical protein